MRLTNRFFSRETSFGRLRGGGGVCPVTFLQPLKNIDFLQLLVSKIYHILPLYCATALFFLDTSSRVALGRPKTKYSD